MIKQFLLSLFVVLALSLDVAQAQDSQSGFVSIDCGFQGSNYTDIDTGLHYISDAGFVDSGMSKSLGSAFSDYRQEFMTVRYFPEGTRNCYSLRPRNGKDGRYLIRARFLYGNYDGISRPPKFDLYIGLQYWETISLTDDTAPGRSEIIHTPLSDHINVCLVKTGQGIPFISVLELRPLDTKMYTTQEPGGSLSLYFRERFNDGVDDVQVRFKDDIYDRIWLPGNLSNTLPISTTSTIDSNADLIKTPSMVMSTALTPTKGSDGRLRFSWDSANTEVKHYMYLHFAELEVLGANQSRTFNVFLNGKLWINDDITPSYLLSETYGSTNAIVGNISYEVELVKTSNSTLLPIINAAELYTLIEFPLKETDEGDVDAMLEIKSIYNLTKNWQGDPCGPEGFQWKGVNCSDNDGTHNPRITSLDLSFQKLVGPIAQAISELKSLEKLDLSHNNLTGIVPEFLAELDSLLVLNLKGNNFSKPFPEQLVHKANSGLLKFDYDEDSNSNNSSGDGKKNIVVPIVVAVGGVLFIICASLLVFFIIRSRKPKETNKIDDTTPVSNMSNASVIKILASENNDHHVIASKSREFTYQEVLQITNNFQRVIGKGGFGAVYHGYVGDIQVAVKMLSPSSTQGYKEFQAEATLLLTIHHKNLTSLVGYCYEGSNMGIIYEYMSNGSLDKHLLGSGTYVLTWDERLRIATDAAQGLEYLHHGCKPPVVHRDVKITNILLDEKFRAKLADFGLSRAFSVEDATHVSTVVAGTPGYLDPEYYTTMRLTEKSDIYSFGIVLMEIVAGRSALPKNIEMNHIITWVSSELEKGDLSNVVDPKMQGDYDVNSVWKVLDVAMSCVARNSTTRPTMNFVVMELKACLSMERARNEIESKDSIGSISLNMESGLAPQAR